MASWSENLDREKQAEILLMWSASLDGDDKETLEDFIIRLEDEGILPKA